MLKKADNATVAGLMWVLFTIGFLAFLIWFNATLSYPLPGDAQVDNRYERAVVVKIVSDTLTEDPDFPDIRIGTQELEMEILTGPDKGKRVLLNNFVTRTDNKPAKVGTKMIAQSYDGFDTGMISSYSREVPVYVLGLIFFASVAIIGKRKGLKAIFALAFTLLCVLFLFVPLLLRGVNPVVAAGIVVILSAAVTLLALNGLSPKTMIAGISCILCTFAAGGIAFAFGAFTNLSTYNTPETEHLIFIAQNTALSIHDILFAGILIATSGAMMDTTMSLASALVELKALNPEMTVGQILRSGMNIGRDIMGTMTNTLILAFTGSGINSLLVIFLYNMPYKRIINMDLLMLEIMKGLSGSIAIVLSIPITAILAARILRSPSAADRGGFEK
ncbi:MAG: YibE/F family protein [Clostridiales Family XIII bacterium]|jgi:uncharacterized membrane protein|nr:YibE/F family protein [Clostridiales Family XIII bacterium]